MSVAAAGVQENFYSDGDEVSIWNSIFRSDVWLESQHKYWLFRLCIGSVTQTFENYTKSCTDTIRRCFVPVNFLIFQRSRVLWVRYRWDACVRRNPFECDSCWQNGLTLLLSKNDVSQPNNFSILSFSSCIYARTMLISNFFRFDFDQGFVPNWRDEF